MKAERFKGKYTCQKVGNSKAPCPTCMWHQMPHLSSRPRPHLSAPTDAEPSLVHVTPGRVDPASHTLKGMTDTHQVQILFGDSLYFSNFTLKLLGEKG